MERKNAVTLRGNPFTLVGPQLKPGDKLPEFTLLSNDLKPVKSSETSGVRVFAAVPSLDTPVCDTETRRFNQEAGKLGGVSIYAVSMDLPFAQKRWCGAAGVSHVQTLSDHRDASFGQAMGTLIKELRLESRAVFVVDGQGTIRYAEYVPEVAEQPNFDAVLKAIQSLHS